MRSVLPIALLVVSALTGTALAADHVWVIGGGPDPGESQAQIEANVNWVISSLLAHKPKPVLHVYFAGGAAPVRDVQRWTRPPDTEDDLAPLARVFGEQEANGNHYRHHRVPMVAGSTEADLLQARLAQEFSTLKPGDRAFIIYNGHGSHDAQDPAANTLRLWNDTRLPARQFEHLLDRVDPAVPVRFVFTQCFAGGFERVIHPQARDTNDLAKGDRCGFMAVSQDDEAEGCSASVRVGDYRDYTTYFFAALDGRTRQGQPLPGNPDLNGDGAVSPYEAHLYVLREAYNADVPRSTSEMFLERWQPWYLRWFDTGSEPDNVYGRLARDVARRNGFSASGLPLIRELDARERQIARQQDSLDDEQARLKPEIGKLQSRLQKEVEQRWPETLKPYTQGYASFLRKDLSAAQDFIVAQPAYRDLAAKQDRYAAIDGDVLDLNRKMAQIEKIRRLRKLARILDQFERHASAKERADYQRLVSCEQLPL